MTRRLLHIRESLASRITLRVVLYVVVVIGISAYVGNYYVLKIVKAIQEGGILYAIGMRRMAIALTAVFLLTMVVLTYLLRRTIHRLIAPLTTFTQAADEVARGNLQAKLPEIHSNDEMYYLRQSFSTMQQSLAQQMEELKQVNEAKGRMEGELKVARDMQLSMLPKAYSPTADSRLDIYGSLTPAREVGGDLYDFFVRDGKLFFCIGDVSGKGVPASLFMAVTRAVFRTVSARESMPDRIMRAMNKTIADMNNNNMFVTLFVGVLDLPTGRLYYCNAGHDAPLLVGSGVGKLACDSNIPVGVMPSWKYTLQESQIFTGTTIFLYTDGLTEAMNSAKEQFLMERVNEVATQALAERQQEPRQLIGLMTSAVQRFVGDAEQSDDLTMMAIQYIKQHRDVRMRQSIVLSNDTKEVTKLNAFVEKVCETVGLPKADMMKVKVSIEEAVVNVMNYAYPPDTRGDVTIEAVSNDVRLKFSIIDSGKPFDPTVQADVDTTLSAKDRSIGGLGIHIVRQFMDSINYERIDNRNVLTLRKKLINE